MKVGDKFLWGFGGVNAGVKVEVVSNTLCVVDPENIGDPDLYPVRLDGNCKVKLLDGPLAGQQRVADIRDLKPQ